MPRLGGVDLSFAVEARQHRAAYLDAPGAATWAAKWFDVADLDLDHADMFPVSVSEDRLDVVAQRASRAYCDRPLPWDRDVRLTLRLQQAVEGGATAVGIAHCSSTPHLRRAMRNQPLAARDVRLGRASDSVALVAYACMSGDIEAHGAKIQQAVCGRLDEHTEFEHTEFTIEWRGTSRIVTFFMNHTPVGIPVNVRRGEDYVFAVGLKPGHWMKIVDCHIIDDAAECFAAF